MSNKAIQLIKKKYFEDLYITDKAIIAATQFDLVTVNRRGNNVFQVSRPGSETSYYEVRKVDLTGLDKLKSLTIPPRKPTDVDITTNKALMAEWIYRCTGHELQEEDIGRLVVDRDNVLVVVSPDSMRFKSSFQLIRS